jgi:hypothetical protein
MLIGYEWVWGVILVGGTVAILWSADRSGKRIMREMHEKRQAELEEFREQCSQEFRSRITD